MNNPWDGLHQQLGEMQQRAYAVVEPDVQFLEFRGTDRAAFLHNLCTQDIKSLAPSQSRETLFTNVQGKTIGYGKVLCEPDRLLLVLQGNQIGRLLPHFDRYLITEDVQLLDTTENWNCATIIGPHAANWLGSVGAHVPDLPGQHLWSTLQDGSQLHVTHLDELSEPAFRVRTSREQGTAWGELLAHAEVVVGEATLIESLRIARGTPRWGIDITDDNLPQEVNRDAVAISFVKGCYLGQETVARIDALGHVNRKLTGLILAEVATAKGAEQPVVPLTSDGKEVGHVTSFAPSPVAAHWIALGYVRTNWQTPGTMLLAGNQSAQVTALPHIG
ncbi:MAG: hypothetical protein KDA60_04370 [Planctomycetales bacterium]|nr:hypothetical protein [Planctomycetales bacterium]